MDFEELLSPLTLAEFRERSWNVRSTLIPGRPDRFAALAFDFDALVRGLHLATDANVDLKAQYFDAKGEHCEIRIEPKQIKGCHAAGMTICVANVDALLPKLAEQSKALCRSSSFSGIMDFSFYWSPSGMGFGLHYDQHPVFILQLEGEKRWWYSREPALRDPRDNFIYTSEGIERLRASGFDVRAPTDDELESVVLKPGDLLYLPAGAWHKTSAVGRESRALTLRAFEGNPTDAVHHCLKTWMDEGPWRRPFALVGRKEIDEHRAPESVRATLSERLHELKRFVGGMTVEDLERAWAELQSRVEPAAELLGGIAPNDRLSVRKNLVVLRVGSGPSEKSYLYDGQSETELELDANSPLREILRVGVFTASDACGWGSGAQAWSDTKELLEDLVREGVIEVVTASAR